MKNLLLTLSICLFTIACYAQKKERNALQYPDLAINDLIPLDSIFFDGFSYANTFYDQAYFNMQSELKFNAIMIKNLTNNTSTLYSGYSPYTDVYFEKYNEIFQPIFVIIVLEQLS